jgi:hypothetical protein
MVILLGYFGKRAKIKIKEKNSLTILYATPLTSARKKKINGARSILLSLPQELFSVMPSIV